MTSHDKTLHSNMANAIRFLSIDGVESANSGHPGLPMGMAEVATVLFRDFLKFDPQNPQWPDRDRFILSAGHGSMLLYSLLYLTGYRDFPLSELKKFRQLHSRTAGHPEYGHGEGIETTTGPLGQGLATAIGMALAERMQNARYGDDLVNHYTYVLASDGDLMEGISHEALNLAGHWKLSKLIVLWDDNEVCIDGKTSTSCSENIPLRFQSAGWDIQTVDGHDQEAVRQAIAKAQTTNTPSMIACKTIIGKGSPNKEGTSGVHGSPLGKDEALATRKALNWSEEPFFVPEDVKKAWEATAQKGADLLKAWQERLVQSGDKGTALLKDLSKDIDVAVSSALVELKKKCLAEKPNWATRVCSQKALEVINPMVTSTVGGSADLTPSNNTKTADMNAISAKDFSGRYIHYGIREHGMAACMNGMALHGGFIPYSGTFLVFADYSRPSLRLAALMKQRVIHVLTHDSIGLGEDGPTHQPVEHLSALRAIPNLNVFRPADSVETAECWDIAIHSTETPSILALSRQNLLCVRGETAVDGDDVTVNKSAKGAYILKEATGTHKVTLMASGSEVEIALEAANQLEASGIGTRLVSVPCLDIFMKQPVEYRRSIVPLNTLRVAVEAGLSQSWDKLLGDEGLFIGMSDFGASAPYKELYSHFGITAENTVNQVKQALKA